MDDKCALCGEELQPGTFPQLQFDGSWVCQDCLTPQATYERITAGERDNRG